MPTQELTEEKQKFNSYASSILKTLKHQVEAKKMNVADVALASIKLSFAQTQEELSTVVQDLLEKFPGLQDANSFYKETNVTNKEEIVKSYISHLIKSGGFDIVGEFSKEATDTSISLEDLILKYPGLGEFIENQNKI